MQVETCWGCGEPLPPQTPRGRRARYHGPACRQRARRARLRSTVGARSWAAVDRIDAAMVTVRRNLAIGTDPSEAIRGLLDAAGALARAHGVDDGSTAVTDVDSAVTENVTELRPRLMPVDDAPFADNPVTDDSKVDDTSGNEHSSESAAVESESHRTSSHGPQPLRLGEPIDLDTVRVERTAEFEHNGFWQVISGTDEAERLVGYLHADRLSRGKWHAQTPNLVEISRTRCRTRKEALLHLLQYWEAPRR